MCGIVYCKNKKAQTAKGNTIKLYKAQKNRGTEGFGYCAVLNGKLDSIARSMTEENIMASLNKETANEFLFHHRFPTSTPNFKEATHPIKVSHKDFKSDFYVVHNGIITNDNELKEKHIKLGFKYTTEIIQKWITTGQAYTDVMWNDSEAFAIELALVISGKKKTIDTEGSVAFIALEIDKKTNKVKNLYFGRNEGNPLKCFRHDNGLKITSEGQGELVLTDTLYCINSKTDVVSMEDLDIGTYKNPIGYSYNVRDVYGDDDKEYSVRDSKVEEYDDIEDDDEYWAMISEEHELMIEQKQCETIEQFDDVAEKLHTIRFKIMSYDKDLSESQFFG